MNIQEDYVSFETAILLKEKGFSELTTKAYPYFEGKDYKYDISYPTLQMAMKWLREVHSLHIWIGHAAGKVLPWYYEIHGITDGKVKHIGGIQCGSYEVACESALKYCLENLI